jgi:hypothetical protein
MGVPRPVVELLALWLGKLGHYKSNRIINAISLYLRLTNQRKRIGQSFKEG